MNRRVNSSASYDISALKHAAAGRWIEILSHLCGVDPFILDTRHHPCPKCGGKDRFRMIDASDGILWCNQCYTKENGDGISAIQWLRECDFQAALKLLAEYLGIEPEKRRRKGKNQPGGGKGKQSARGKDRRSSSDATATRTAPEILHAAYTAALTNPLGRLTLSADHERQLAARGLTPEWYAAFGYRSLPGRSSEDPANNPATDPNRWPALAAICTAGKHIAGVPGITNTPAPRLLSQPGLLIPSRNVDGQITALVVRPDEPGDSGKYRFLSSRTKRNPNGARPESTPHVPVGIKDFIERARSGDSAAPTKFVSSTHTIVRVTEGALKADVAWALSGLPTIGIHGVAPWKRTLPVLQSLGATHVIISFDADAWHKAGVAGPLRDFTLALADAGFAVAIEHWDPAHGKGIDDVLAAGHMPQLITGTEALEHVRKVAEAAGTGEEATRGKKAKGKNKKSKAKGTEPVNSDDASRAGENAENADDDKPIILTDQSEEQVVNRCILALTRHPKVYWFRDALCHVVRGGKPPKAVECDDDFDIPLIRPLKKARLSGMLSELATFGTGEVNDLTPARSNRPPQWATEGVLDRGEWKELRWLTGVIESPTIRPKSGTILAEPGYDPETGLLLLPSAAGAAMPKISDHPSQDDARRAAGELLEVIADFPFISDTYRSAWLAAVLTIIARPAILGPTPLFLTGANVPGAGKGLLLDTLAQIATGKSFARTAAPTTDDEWRKRITAIAIANMKSVLIDNIDGTLGAPSLDAALTSTIWQDRLLGKNEMTPELPLTCVWFATGNNVSLAGDLPRRVLPITMLSPLENPQERDDFRHPDLLRWTTENRPRLLAAALTILRAYFVAGRPSHRLKSWGSYEAWSDLIREAVVFAGLADPVTAREGIADHGESKNELAQLIAAWEIADPDCKGITTARMLEIADQKHFSAGSQGDQYTHPDLREILTEVFGTAPGKLPSAKAVGKKLSSFKDRVFENKNFRSDTKNRTGTKIWKIGTLPQASGAWFTWFAESNFNPKETSGESVSDAHAHAHTHAHTLGLKTDHAHHVNHAGQPETEIGQKNSLRTNEIDSTDKKTKPVESAPADDFSDCD